MRDDLERYLDISELSAKEQEEARLISVSRLRNAMTELNSAVIDRDYDLAVARLRLAMIASTRAWSIIETQTKFIMRNGGEPPCVTT